MATPLNLSIIKAFTVLGLFRDAPDGLSMSEVAREVGLNVPTAHRILQTLRSVGAIKLDGEGRFVIGEAIAALGNGLVESADDILQRHTRALGESLGETVHVAVLVDGMIRIVAKAHPEGGIAIPTKVGSESEAYCTGIGKALLAHLPSASLRSYCRAGDFIRLTSQTLARPEDMLSDLQRSRSRGYAVDRGEFIDGIKCIAVPVSLGGTVRAAISMSAQEDRLPESAEVRIADRLLQAARKVAADLGPVPQQRRA